MERRKIVHLTPTISRLGGGLFSSVRHLSQFTHAVCDADISVITLEDSDSVTDAKHWAPLEVRTHKVTGPFGFGYAPTLFPDLQASDTDIVHLHGIWKYPSLATLRWGRKTGRPYVVSPHGMLEPWALQQSKLKKLVANLLYQRECLRKSALLRATSRMELRSIRKAGYSNPVAVIPNGVEFPEVLPSKTQRPPGQPRRMLFLSRIHPKKGLLNLVEAWGRLRPANWELHIMGPNEGGHQGEVEAVVSQKGLASQIKFPGEMWSTEARTQVYRDSDVFVLPTFSENFGLVIAEALACEVPVITTKGAPWAELESHRCGWWIDIGVDPLVNTLRTVFSIPQEELTAMGSRGRKLIEDRYRWEPIGRQMVAAYKWIRGTGPKPEFVF